MSLSNIPGDVLQTFIQLNGDIHYFHKMNTLIKRTNKQMHSSYTIQSNFLSRFENNPSKTIKKSNCTEITINTPTVNTLGNTYIHFGKDIYNLFINGTNIICHYNYDGNIKIFNANKPEIANPLKKLFAFIKTHKGKFYVKLRINNETALSLDVIVVVTSAPFLYIFKLL